MFQYTVQVSDFRCTKLNSDVVLIKWTNSLPPVIAGLQLLVVRRPRQCLKPGRGLFIWESVFSADKVTDPELLWAQGRAPNHGEPDQGAT